MKAVELLVACDVETLFVDAARVFAPQKGATPKQVELLERRLVALQDGYRNDYDVDLADVVGAGAAGGLAGGLVVLGGTDHARRRRRRRSRSNSTTASRRPTSSSPAKAFSTAPASPARSSAGIVERAEWADKPVLVVVGDADDEGLAAAAACASAADGDLADRASTARTRRAPTRSALVAQEVAASSPNLGQ